MKNISNSDLAYIIRFLEDYSHTPDGGSLKAYNMRRIARRMLPRLIRKYEDDRTSDNREPRR